MSLVDYAKFKSIHSSLLKSFEKQEKNEYYRYSTLWSGIFSHRRPTRELSDLLVALNEASTATEGVAGKVPDNKKNLFVDYHKTFMDSSWLEEYPMSWLGAPSVLDFDDHPAAVQYLNNLKLFIDFKSSLEAAKAVKGKPLHVVEIGAGYGGLAYFMLKSGLVASYTIIDLPENLKISAFYLSQNFSDRSYNASLIPDAIAGSERKDLNFVAAGNIGALSKWKFDLAINSDSLGEMPANTASAYVKWIHEHLNTEGYFFTKNGHNRGIDSVQFPHEYGYSAYKLVSLKPPGHISYLFDDFSHYALLQKTETVSKPVYPEYYFDVIGSLYATGLQDELTAISDSFVNNQLTSEEERFLKTCDRFFTAKAPKEKSRILEDQPFTGDYEACVWYLNGLSKFLAGDLKGSIELLSKYLPIALSYVGEAYAIMIMAQRDASVLNQEFRFGAKTRFAIDEIVDYHQMKPPFKKLALLLRTEPLRKKINYPSNYRPSTLLKAKNVIFNLREGRGLTTIR